MTLRCFVAGGEGFIGRHLAAALRAAGHDVVVGTRTPSTLHAVECDFYRDLDPAVWAARLAGVEVVINAVGILRESCNGSFQRIHVEGPRALFEGCRVAGIRRVIQISAIGPADADEFIASKHRADAELANMDLDWTIVRPSVVYSVRGSYGGTSLLRAMAALPGILCVPGAGDQLIQPILAEDLALAVVHMIQNRTAERRLLTAVGPQQVTLLTYLQAMRRWLELPSPLVIPIPMILGWCGAWVGEHLGNGPTGLTTWRLLLRGNVGSPESVNDLATHADVVPRSLQQAFDGRQVLFKIAGTHSCTSWAPRCESRSVWCGLDQPSPARSCLRWANGCYWAPLECRSRQATSWCGQPVLSIWVSAYWR